MKLFGAVIVAGLVAASCASAQSISQTYCASSYSKSGNYRSSCTSVYIPPAPPPKPVTPYRAGPGSREDVVVRGPSTGPVVTARPVSANHCGDGFVYDRTDGCQPARR